MLGATVRSGPAEFQAVAKAPEAISGSCEVEAVITCPKCSKDNQDHYKFCLGCGAELPRDAAPKPFSPQTPPPGARQGAGQAAAAAGLAGTVAVAQSPVMPSRAPAPMPVAAA